MSTDPDHSASELSEVSKSSKWRWLALAMVMLLLVFGAWLYKRGAFPNSKTGESKRQYSQWILDYEKQIGDHPTDEEYLQLVHYRLSGAKEGSRDVREAQSCLVKLLQPKFYKELPDKDRQYHLSILLEGLIRYGSTLPRVLDQLDQSLEDHGKLNVMEREVLRICLLRYASINGVDWRKVAYAKAVADLCIRAEESYSAQEQAMLFRGLASIIAGLRYGRHRDPGKKGYKPRFYVVSNDALADFLQELLGDASQEELKQLHRGWFSDAKIRLTQDADGGKLDPSGSTKLARALELMEERIGMGKEAGRTDAGQ